jgi:subtilase family serine protease
VPSRLTQPIDETQRTTLSGTLHRLAIPANDLGLVNDDQPLERVQLVLKRSDAQEAELTQLIQQMHTPGSANFHQWLTPEQFGERFGPSDADIAVVTAWLQAHGMTVNKVNPGKQTIDFSTTAGQFRQTFQAPIHRFSVKGETHYANVADPQIPSALAPVIGGFATLNNFRLKSNAERLGSAQLDPVSHKTTPQWTEGLSGVSLVLAPGDFAVQYDVNKLYTAGTTGAGQTIGIVNDSNISLTLASQYRSLFGLSNNPPTVIVDGNDPGIDGVNNPDGANYDSGEAYIDVEEAGAVAPGAAVDLFIAADTELSYGLYLAAERAVYSNLASVISVSFGACEAAQGPATNSFINALWEQAAAQGQTVTVSSGDSGSAVCDRGEGFATGGQAVSSLSGTPYNVSVGGTDFYYSSYNSTQAAQNAQLQQYWSLTASNTAPTVSLLQKAPEQPWNDSQYGFNLFNQYADGYGTTIAGGSGGASNCFTGSGSSCAGLAKPSWQVGTGVPADGVRDQPDVSLFAANGANFSFYPFCASDGDCQAAPSGGEIQISGYGGTSVASPAFAGIMALVNQKYGRQGQANYTLYPLAAQYPSAFNDVTIGTNTVPCAATTTSLRVAPLDCLAVTNPILYDDPTYGSAYEGEIGNTSTKVVEYNAAAGYDLASGLGTIDAYNLVTNWPNVKFASSTVTLTPSSTNFAHGTAITISGSVTPATSTGNVALLTTSTGTSQAAQTVFTLNSSGAFSQAVQTLPGGTYNIYGSFSGNGTEAASTSTPVQITVTPEASKVTLAIANAAGGTAVANGGTVPYGTQLLLTATPAASSGSKDGTPTGTVAMMDSGTLIDTATVNYDGNASFNDGATVGTHAITANYSGDSSYSASSSSAISFTVSKDVPELLFGVTSPTGYTQAGSSFIVAVENISTVSYNNGLYTPVAAPTGAVTITGLPTGTLTSPTLQSSVDPDNNFIEGVASVAVPSSLAPGNYSVTLTYAGDGNYSGVTESGTLSVVSASLTNSTTTATVSSGTTSPSAAVTVNTTVTGASGKGAPTGTVVLISNNYIVAELTTPTASSGVVSTYTTTLSSQTLLQGVNSLVVQYNGSSIYNPSSTIVSITAPGASAFVLSNAGPVTLNAGNTASPAITIQPAGGFTGSVGLTCAVTSASALSPAPTCSIASSASVTGVSPVNATVSLNTTANTALGNYTVTVTGSSGVVVSTTQIPVTVLAAVVPPTIALTNSGPITISAPGGSGTSTATVTPGGGFTGSVALSCSVAPTTGTSVPTCSIGPTVSITGTAAVTSTLTVSTTSTTTAGAYTVTLTASASGVTTQTTTVAVTVNPAAVTPAFMLSNSGAITIASPGGSGTSTITVTPSGGFTGSVALACAVTATPLGAIDTPGCTVSTPGAITGTTPQTATLTVSTTAASAQLDQPILPFDRLLKTGGGLSLAALLCLLLPARRRRLPALLAVFLLCLVCAFATGCGGSGSSGSGGGGNSGTTLGSYTVTVTGTASGATTQTTAVSVTLN